MQNNRKVKEKVEKATTMQNSRKVKAEKDEVCQIVQENRNHSGCVIRSSRT